MPSVKDVMIQAINEKKSLRVVREGRERFICPFRIGWSRKNEYNVIHYQFGGYTSKPEGLSPDGSTDNWRCQKVSSFSEAEVIPEKWHEPTVKPKTRGHCVVIPDAEVKYYY